MKILILLRSVDINPRIKNFTHEISAFLKDRAHCEFIEISNESNLEKAQISLARDSKMLGIGGCQKLAIRHAIKNKFNFLASFNVDKERNIKNIQEFLDKILLNPEGDFFFAAHKLFITPSKIFDLILNVLSESPHLTWNTTIKAFRVETLSTTLFDLNTAGPHFDTELTLQFLERGSCYKKVTNLGSSQYSLIRGLQNGYFKNSLKACLKYRLQRYNLFFDIRFHPEFFNQDSIQAPSQSIYQNKYKEDSPHSFLQKRTDLIKQGGQVLDIGCSTGYISRFLSEFLHCNVLGVDILNRDKVESSGWEYQQLNLENETDLNTLHNIIKNKDLDHVLLLDVIEHLSEPEKFLLRFYRHEYRVIPNFLISTGNVGFIFIRLMLLVGLFNYGKQGILDITHKRLFTYRNFKNLLEQTGFVITNRFFFPIPFRKLGFTEKWACFFEKIHNLLIKFSPSLFAYQIMFEAKPGVMSKTD